jgi:hypothetical protein
MLSGDKRASLSSDLLAAQDQPQSGDGDAERAPPAASLFVAPRGGARRRVLAAVKPALDEVPENAMDAADDAQAPPPAAEPGPAESVLYSKGDASASGFRPWYWSYERDGAAPPREAGERPAPAVAPLDAAPPSRTAGPTTRSGRAGGPKLAMALMAGLGTLALVGAATMFLLSRGEPQASAGGAPAAVMAPALPMAAPAPAAPKPTVVAALPAPASPARAAPMPPEEMAELMARGAKMLATGDIAAARLFFERAAEGGNAAAAREAGKTYDPLALAEAHARGIRGDPVAAARWYRKASEGGDKQADLLMKRLMAKYAG